MSRANDIRAIEQFLAGVTPEGLAQLGAPSWASEAHGIAARETPTPSGQRWGSVLQMRRGEGQEVVRLIFDHPRAVSLTWSAPGVGLGVNAPRFQWLIVRAFGLGSDTANTEDPPRTIEGQLISVFVSRVDPAPVVANPATESIPLTVYATPVENARSIAPVFTYANVVFPAPGGIVAIPPPPVDMTHLTIATSNPTTHRTSFFLLGQTFNGIENWSYAAEGFAEYPGVPIIRGATAYRVAMDPPPAAPYDGVLKFFR